MDMHWPNFRGHWFPEDAELLEVEPRPYNHGPFHLKVRRILQNVTEEEAVCMSLATAMGCKISIDWGPAFKLTGTRDSANGIAAFTMTRAA